MSVNIFLVEIFYKISENVDLLIALQEKSEDHWVIKINPLGSLCSQIHDRIHDWCVMNVLEIELIFLNSCENYMDRNLQKSEAAAAY